MNLIFGMRPARLIFACGDPIRYYRLDIVVSATYATFGFPGCLIPRRQCARWRGNVRMVNAR